MSSKSAIAYERHAQQFLEARDRSTIGAHVVERWARSLPANTDILEIACGGGIPITRTVASTGLNLWAVDSSPTLTSMFKTRFPAVPIDCTCAMKSDFFGRKFGAVLSIGLIFLLNEDDQIRLIDKVARVLVPRGRFLFTAPVETGTWIDINTGHRCQSFGRDRYEDILQAAQFNINSLTTYQDEGQNNYYDVVRVSPAEMSLCNIDIPN